MASSSTRNLPPRRLVSEVRTTDITPRALQLTESKNNCWIVSPTAQDSQLASAFSRNTAIHFVGRQQQNWSDCHVTSHRSTNRITPTHIHSEVEEILASLTVTDAEVRYVDKSTVNQAACLTWFMVRAGRITASLACSVLHTRLDHPSASFVKGICRDSCKPFYIALQQHGGGCINCLQQHRQTHTFQTRQDQASFVPRIPVHRSISCRQLAHCACHSDRVTKGR